MTDLMDQMRDKSKIEYPTVMKREALVFLENPLARRLAVAWEACGGDDIEWPYTAGITTTERADAERLMEALRRNGICRSGGVTDPAALQYITAVVAKPILGGGTRGKKRK